MLSKYSVKRPYTVIVGVILVVVLGVVSFTRMTTDLLPDMNLPYALVITTDVGASPEEVESDVTAPIESAMATTSNIKNVSSVSRENMSLVISFICLSICILMIVFSCSSCKSSEHIVVDDSHSVSIPC